MRRAEFIMAGFLLIVSIAYSVEALRLPYGGRVGPGPGFLPIWTGVVGIITSLLLIGRAWRLSGAAVTLPSPFDGQRTLAGMLPVAAALVGWVALATLLGGIAAIGIFLFVVTWWLAGREERTGAQRVVMAGATTAIVTVAIFLIFQAWLDIRLPAGLLGDRA